MPVSHSRIFSYSGGMIEKVGYSKPVTSAKSVRRTGGADGVAFAAALSEAEGVKATAPTAPVAALGGITGLIGINEVDEGDVRKRRAVKRGRFTLEALDQLRNALLMGTLPLSILRNLEKLIAEERAEVTDPGLSAILDDIELRAAVEMAKLEMAGLIAPKQQ